MSTTPHEHHEDCVDCIGEEEKVGCIRCGGPGADEECVECGSLSCNAHGFFCGTCDENFCFQCYDDHKQFVHGDDDEEEE